MFHLTKHRLIRIGGSRGITIPKKFLEATNLQVGDRISIEFDREFKTLYVKPQKYHFHTFLSPTYYSWIKDLKMKFPLILKRIQEP